MQKRTLRVFVASPSDVTEEREALAKLITELNNSITVIAPEKQLTLEIVRWETHAFPSAGRPQAVITEQIGEYDVFVGIMWTRFGTPTGTADSGTQEEFDFAYQSWRKHGWPHILFYFCNAPAPPPGSSLAAEQLSRVVTFRQKLSEMALVWEYGSHSEFAEVVRPHLLRVIAKAMAAGEPARQTIVTAPSATDVTFVQSQLQRLAAEYAQIRATMPPGDTRTRQMEIIVTRMRSFALAAEPLLPSLSESQSPGERLAAISILQVTPKAEYIKWLGDRCSESQPFIGYHAAVTLLTNVRVLDCAQKAELESAIVQGLTYLGEKRDTDRYRILTSAIQELKARCPER